MTIDLALDTLPLENRRCGRCGSRDFRLLIYIPRQEQAQCADCGYRSGREHCGRIIRFKTNDDQEEIEINRCGDWIMCESADPQSQSSIPLAVCLGCKRLVAAK